MMNGLMISVTDGQQMDNLEPLTPGRLLYHLPLETLRHKQTMSNRNLMKEEKRLWKGYHTEELIQDPPSYVNALCIIKEPPVSYVAKSHAKTLKHC